MLAEIYFSRALNLENQMKHLYQFDDGQRCIENTKIQFHEHIAELYATAISHRSDHSIAYFRIGLLFEERGIKAEALSCQKNAIAVSPNYESPQYALGR